MDPVKKKEKKTFTCGSQSRMGQLLSSRPMMQSERVPRRRPCPHAAQSTHLDAALDLVRHECRTKQNLRNGLEREKERLESSCNCRSRLPKVKFQTKKKVVCASYILKLLALEPSRLILGSWRPGHSPWPRHKTGDRSALLLWQIPEPYSTFWGFVDLTLFFFLPFLSLTMIWHLNRVTALQFLELGCHDINLFNSLWPLVSSLP